MTKKALSIILPDGTPDGVKIYNSPNFELSAIVVPRSRIKDLQGRKEKDWAALYSLFGEPDSNFKKTVYIGKTTKIYERLKQHDSDINKDFWNTVVIFVSRSFNEAEIGYLERKLISLAKSIGRYDVTNTQKASGAPLNEQDEIKAIESLEQIKFISALLGYYLFEEVPEQESVDNLYQLKIKKALARGTILEGKEFVVYKRSTANFNEAPHFEQLSASNLRNSLIKKGILKKINDEVYELTEDYTFTSPSAAGDTLAGSGTNGWLVWKDKDGRTLDENVRQ